MAPAVPYKVLALALLPPSLWVPTVLAAPAPLQNNGVTAVIVPSVTITSTVTEAPTLLLKSGTTLLSEPSPRAK